MAIYYQNNIFKLQTKNSSYFIAIVDEEKFIGHVYYGKKVPDDNLNYLLRLEEPPFVPSKNNRDRVSFYDSFPMEYPGHGLGDYREDCITVKTGKGSTACQFTYDHHKIYSGKPELPGLPATFDREGTCTTLELVGKDEILNLELTLLYTIFEEEDAIARSTRIVNQSEEVITLTKALSACVDLDSMDYDMITLHGSWARERHVQRKSVGYGKQGVFSTRGESGHQMNPFFALVSSDATEDMGEAYGFNFVYSGNFMAQAEGCQFDTTRVVMGIHPEDFSWPLKPGESFNTPEVVMVYSAEGIGGMSRRFHDLYRNHLIRGEYRDKKRPILINNWEATYFDFDSGKLLDIAKEAAGLGIEMLVMDDGWFGGRKDDNRALGDWFVNEDKIQGGLKKLVEEVNDLGLEFGIWVEPEMISPDSDLYRAHPDWAFAIEGRDSSLARNQYVLDFTRSEVRDHIYQIIYEVLTSANIRYVKWDMNRPLSNVGSALKGAEEQGQLYHKYVLGVYELMNRLTTDFPHILLENCSGGGARFDPGMLYYSPQIWCSDDTDAIERLSIQRGTAMVYPLSCMGAHVSDCPNHTVGRTTPFETRGHVALAGTFGYELDITRIPSEDREEIPRQVALYHKYNDLVRTGDYYRIGNYNSDNRYFYAGDNQEYDCWQVVSKDKKETMVTFVQVKNRANSHSRRIRLKGLEESGIYIREDTKETYSGAALMHAGILIREKMGDFSSAILHFMQEK